MKNKTPILVSNLSKKKRRLAGYVLRKPKSGSWLQIPLGSLWLCSCHSVNKLTPCGGKMMAVKPRLIFSALQYQWKEVLLSSQRIYID